MNLWQLRSPAGEQVESTEVSQHLLVLPSKERSYPISGIIKRRTRHTLYDMKTKQDCDSGVSERKNEDHEPEDGRSYTAPGSLPRRARSVTVHHSSFPISAFVILGSTKHLTAHLGHSVAHHGNERIQGGVCSLEMYHMSVRCQVEKKQDQPDRTGWSRKSE